MLTLSAALALALAAVPAAGAAPARAVAPDTVSFRFGWPDALAAEVETTRTRTRPGRPSTAHTLKGRLETEVRGAERRVGFRGWRLAGGQPAPAGLDPLIGAAGQITTVTTRAGAFVRVEGMEAALAALRATTKDAPAEARPMLDKLQQLAPAMLTKDASELWAVLVQLWDGKDLDVGEDYEMDSRLPVTVLPGETVRVVTRLRVERRLTCPGGGSCVEVGMRSEPDAKDVERVAKRLFAELSVPAQATAMLGEMSAVTEVALVTEPARLVPHRMAKVRKMRVASAPGAAPQPPAEGRDASVYTFTYVAAAAGRR